MNATSLFLKTGVPVARDASMKATEWVNTLVPAYVRDLQGNILSANTAFTQRFPAYPGPGRNFADLIHPEDGARQGSLSPLMLSGGTRLTAMHRWPTRQGWRWFTWEEEVIEDEQGDVCGIAAVGFDTTRQKLSEELYLKLSRALEQSPVAIIVTDTSGRAQYANPRYTQSLGCTLEDLLEKNQPVLAADHATPEAYQQFLAQVLSGVEWRGECSRQNSAGATIWESVQVNAVRSASGDVINLLCLREDITERRNLERQLRQAQKMDDLGALASGIAHDFNNILAVINGYAELSRLQLSDQQKLEKNLNEIRRATQRAGSIVRQILMFSRKAETGSAPVDFNAQLRELGAMLSETFPRNIPFIYNLAEGLPTLLADQSQMQQVVLNLCVNARDAMPNGGTLTLATSVVAGRDLDHATADAGKRYLCFEVTDTGTGMTEEVRRRLFEPFFTTKNGNQGTGPRTGRGVWHRYGTQGFHRGPQQTGRRHDL
jgi:two-component system cell cycle sensor histidine kinase/response regulator CckA